MTFSIMDKELFNLEINSLKMAFKRNGSKKIKKDYQAKNLSNPFFRKKAKPKQTSSFIWFKVIMIFLLTALVVWFFLLFSYWDIKNIDIRNFERLSPEKVEERVYEQMAKKSLLFFSQKNIFLFKGKGVINDLKEEFNLSDLKIKKKLNKTLIVSVVEKPCSYIFCEKDNYYFSSNDNYLISTVTFLDDNNQSQDALIMNELAPKAVNDIDLASTISGENVSKEGSVSNLESVELSLEEKKEYIIIENKNKNSLIKNNEKIALSEDYLSYIFELSRELKKYPELEVDRFIIIDQYFNSVFVKIKEGPQIYFNVNLEINKQLENLFLVKSNKIKESFKDLEYIDLRYGDKVYFFPETVIN